MWNRVKLSEIASSIDYGHTASSTDKAVGPKFLRITDIQDGNVDWNSVPFCECTVTEEASSKLKPGDIVFARTGATTGKSFLIKECPEKAIFASYLIRVRAESSVLPDYLAHFFRTPEYWSQISLNARGAAQLGVNATTLKSLSIPVPPIAEQKRIAAILDKAEELRSLRRKSIEQLEAIVQSIFLEMFGDPETNSKNLPIVKLADVSHRVTDGTHQPPKWSATGVPFLFVSNIVNGQINFETHKFISDETYLELTRRCQIEMGDVLYTTVGSYGNAALVSTTKKFAFQRHIAHVKPDVSKINPTFLAATLQSSGVRRQVDRVARGVAQKTVNLIDLKNLIILQPPPSLQQEFARRVEAIERLKTTHRESLTHLDALFASLQHRAFQGEL